MTNEMQVEILTVPEFDKNDYIVGVKPFEWLYQFKDDKFKLRQMTEMVKAQAGSVGIKCFTSLWNAYLEEKTKQKQEGIQAPRGTEFTSQPIELYSGDYICDDSGVSKIDRYGYEQIICRHPLLPSERLVNIDTGDEMLKLSFKKGRKTNSWRSVIVKRSVISSASAILQLSDKGIMVNADNAKALSTYIFDLEDSNYDDITQHNSVGRLGWVGEHGFSPYVDDLLFDGEDNFKSMFNAVREQGEAGEWIDAMRAVRAEKTPARLFLAASFASAILSPCGLLPFFLHAWGGTETGKTVGLMIAASVWACPKMGEYITTFNSTLVGQEMMASFLNSLPMCIDELQIQASAGVKDFDRMIYQLTEGIGRTRGSKTGGLQRVNTWKNCFISSGEHPISHANSGGGAVNRIIEFECANKVYSDLVGLCSIINQNYGFAGKMFIKYLQSEGKLDEVRTLQKDYYRQLLKSDSTDKQAASASAILAADKIATDLIFKDGNNLTVEDMVELMTKKSDVNVHARAYDFIMELVARNPTKFNYSDRSSEIWGKAEGNYIYIIKSVFDTEMQNAGYNSTAFLAWAKREDLLECDKDRRTKKCRIIPGSSPVNCVCIREVEENSVAADVPDDLDIDF